MKRDVVIGTRDLTRRFGETMAVDRLSLEVYAGEIFGFLGHNGAGKTTTIRLLNGVLSQTAGDMQVLGLNPRTEGPDLRRRTGVLTEMPSLEERLTARDNLRLYADLYGFPEDRVGGRMDELLAFFELIDRMEEKVGGYSKGMKQRLALARAILHEPQILFLDEPTSGLDPVSARRVHELITRLSRIEKRTVFLCTHNLNEAQRLCDRVGVMERGRLIALGTPLELAQTLDKTQRVEIEVEPATRQQALDLLARRGFSAATENGNTGLVVHGVPRGKIPEVNAALVANQIPVFRIATQEVTLEDFYFAIHGNKEDSR